MASSELGSTVDTRLTALSINTAAEVAAFRALPRRGSNNLMTVLAAMQTSLGRGWISRKRVRHDALRLLNEGAL